MKIRWLAFDLTGTVFDWHRTLQEALLPHWPARRSPEELIDFAGEYNRATVEAIIGRIDPDFDFADVVKNEFDARAQRWGLNLGDDARRAVVESWSRMACWPDAASGLALLGRQFRLAAFTVLTTDQATHCSRHSGLTWHEIISCDRLRVYKTHPAAYASAARTLRAEPAEIMMVACHTFDLDAARQAGYATGFVHRPQEYGRTTALPEEASGYDVVATDFCDLAARLSLQLSPRQAP